MAQAVYTADASQLFRTIEQIKTKFAELHKLNTEAKIGAKLAPGALRGVHTQVTQAAAQMSATARIDIKARVVGMVEAARQLREAFSRSVMVKVQPYLDAAALTGIKSQIAQSAKVSHLEIGLKFQSGAAASFRETLRAMLRVLSRSAFVEAELRLRGAARALDGLKNKKVLLDVEVAPGTAAKIRALLALLKQLKDGAKVPIKLDIEPGLLAILRTLGADLKRAADEAARLDRLMGRAAGAAGNLGQNAGHADSALSRMGRSIASFASSLILVQGLNAAFRELKAAIIDYPALLETANVGMTQMFDGNQKKAAEMMSALRAFAIPTPFATEDLIPKANQALAFGLVDAKSKDAVKEMISLLTDVGNAAFGLGRGQEGVDRMLLAFGQMRSATRVMGSDMLQLQALGINAWEYLAKATGKTTGEVRDLVSKGLIPAKEGIEAIRAGLRGRFDGGMEAAAKTFTGALAQLKDSSKDKLSKFFEPQFKQLSDFAQKAAKVLGSKEFDRWMNNFAGKVSSTFAFATGIYDGFVQEVRAGNPVLLAVLAALGARFLWLANAAIGKAVFSAGVSLGKFAGSILALPAPLLIAIGAAVAFGYAYKKNFLGVADITDTVVSGVVDGVKTLTWALGKAVETVAGILQKIPDAVLLLNPAAAALKGVLGDQTGLADGLLGDFDKFDSKAHKFRQSLEGALDIDSLGAEIKKVIGGLLPNISAALGEKSIKLPGVETPDGFPKIATPDAPDKAAKAAERAAAKEKALALRREKDALADMATVYERNAKAFEATAKAVADGAKKQLDVLTGVRDSLRDTIGEMQSQFVALGIINDPLAPLIRGMERVLNLSGKSSKFIADTKAQIQTLDRLANGERDKANDARSRNERLSGLDGVVPGAAGGSSSSGASAGNAIAGTNIGNRIADAAVAMQRRYGDRIGREFYRQCDRLADATVNSATSIYNKIMGPKGKGDSAARTMARFQKAGIGGAPDGQYAAGDIGYSGARYGRGAGHVQVRGKDGNWYDQYGAHAKATTPIQWVVRNGGANAPTSATRGAGARGGASAGAQSGDPTRTEFDAVPLADSLAKIAAIDAAWGKAVKNTEENSQRFTLQSQLATKAFQTQLATDAAAAGKTIPQMVAWYRNFANTADYLLNAARATDAVTASIRELKDQRAALGTENNPLVAILKEFGSDGKFAHALDGADALLKKARAIRAELDKPDEKRTKSGQTHLEQQALSLEQQAQKVLSQRGDKLREQSGLSLDQVTKATKEATDAESDRLAVLARARGVIGQATAGTDAYDRALESANREFEVWRSPDIKGLLEMRDTYFELASAARELSKAAGLSKQDKAQLEATAKAYATMGNKMGAEANTNAQTRIGAGVGSAEQGRQDKRDIGVADFNRSTADVAALAIKEREILLNDRLSEQARDGALARAKFISDTRAQLRSEGYTDGTNGTPDAAGVEANRRANATDFRAGEKTSAIADYNAVMLEASRAQNGFADETMLAGQKWDIAKGKLESLTEAQKRNYLTAQATTAGASYYGAQRGALQSQTLQTQIELEGRRLALADQVGPLVQQELKWKQEDIETSRRLAGLTNEQRAAYEAQRPAVLALRDGVRELFKESEKVAAAEWFKTNKRAFGALMEPDEIKRSRIELEVQLREQGFTDPIIIKAILDESDVYAEAARTVGRLRDFVGQVQGVFESGFKAAQEKGPKAFFSSVIQGAADMVADISRKLLSAALTNLFMKAFPGVAGVFDESAKATDRLTNATIKNGIGAAGLAIAYDVLTASVKAYTEAAGAAGGGGTPTSGGGVGGILGGLFGGDNGIFAGLFGGGGGNAATGALGTATDIGGGNAIYAAIGNSYIERDGQHVIAHRGEAILTARENELYRASMGQGSATYGGGVAASGGPVNITNVFNITESKSARETAAHVGRAVEQTMSRRSQQQGAYDGIAPGGRQR